MTAKARLSLVGAATVMVLAIAACGGTTTSSDSTPSVSATPTTAGPSNGATQSAAEKVSANTASENEIAAALSAAGVSNAERWAHEVVEYRPYPADDPNLAKLRENLAKYNPGQETTDKIVSALTL
jgi:ABC-type glycerol-3-phosphate transport system substrate-binding protein